MNSEIDIIIKNLYERTLKIGSEVQNDKEFKKDFFNLVEKVTFSMMNGEDNFFALFLIQLKREIRLDIASACESKAALSYFIIYFNPYIFLQCNLYEMQALIKHEIYHIMYNHIKQANILEKKYSTTAVNTAMDISINQYINNLPPFSLTIENARLAYNVDLKYDKTLEYYAEKLQNSINNRINEKGKKIENNKAKQVYKNFDSSHSHEIWNESLGKYDMEQIDEVTTKMVRNSAKGKLPAKIEEFIKNLNKKAEISWQDYLKRIVGTLPHKYRKTITRRNRRQQDRLDLRGQLSNHIIQIAVAIDVSGSITDGEFDAAIVEIINIMSKNDYEITIIECDNVVRRVYKVHSKKDLKKKIDTRGGTSFSPVFEYMNKHNMRDHLLVYFTDGMGEKDLTCKPQNKRILWVITGQKGDLSLNKSYGLVKKLKNYEAEKFDIYKEVLFNRGEWANNEWAK